MAHAIPLLPSSLRLFHHLPPSPSFFRTQLTVSPNNPTTPLYVFQKHTHCHLSSSWGYELLQIRELVFSTEFPKYKSYCPEKVPGNVCWKEVNVSSTLLEIRWVNVSKTGLVFSTDYEMWASATPLPTLLLSPPNYSTFIKSFPLLPLNFPFSN